AIECRDHLIPPRSKLLQAFPELLPTAAIEICNRNALLLDPGVITEIEHALPLARRGIQNVLGVCAKEILSDDLRSQLRRHFPRVMPALQILAHFAAIHRCRIGGDGQDDIAIAEIEVPCELYRRDNVRDAGKTEHLKLPEYIL